MDRIEQILFWLLQGGIYCQFYIIFICLKIFKELKLSKGKD